MLDGRRSRVWRQADNRMHAARGLLAFLPGSAREHGASGAGRDGARPGAGRRRRPSASTASPSSSASTPVTSQPQLVELLAGDGHRRHAGDRVARPRGPRRGEGARAGGATSSTPSPSTSPSASRPHDHLRRVLAEWVAEVAHSGQPRRPAHAARLRPRRRLGPRPLRPAGPARHRGRRRHAAVRGRRRASAAPSWPRSSATWPAWPSPPGRVTPSEDAEPASPAATGATLWHGRFAGGPAEELLAYTVSLPFDRRLWPRRHRRLAGPRPRVWAGPACSTTAEVAAVLDALDQVRGRAGRGHVRLRADRRGHPHRDRAPGHRAGRSGRRQAPHRPQPQRPGGHRPAPVVQATSCRSSRRASSPCSRCCSTGRGRGRRLPARLHPPAAGPAGAAGPPPAGPRLGAGRDVDRLLATVARLDVSPLGAGALAGSSLPLDPAFTAGRPRLRRRLRQLASTPSATATSWPRRCSTSRSSPSTSPASARSGCCGRARSSASPASTTRYATGSSMLPQKKNPDIAELARGKAGRADRRPHRAAGHAEGPAARLQPRPAGGQGAAVRRGRPGAPGPRRDDGNGRHGHVRPRADAGRRRRARRWRPPTWPSGWSSGGCRSATPTPSSARWCVGRSTATGDLADAGRRPPRPRPRGGRARRRRAWRSAGARRPAAAGPARSRCSSSGSPPRSPSSAPACLPGPAPDRRASGRALPSAPQRRPNCAEIATYARGVTLARRRAEPGLLFAALQRDDPARAEGADGAVDVELVPGVVDVEVAHRQLADAVERAERAPRVFSIDSRSGW